MNTICRTAVSLMIAAALPACSRTAQDFSCPITPASHAYVRTGDIYGDSIVLPNGRLISPAGTQVPVTQFPVSAALSPDGSFLAVGGAGYGTSGTCESSGGCAGLSLVTLSTLTVTTLPLRDHWIGLAFSPAAGPQGWRLAVSGGIADTAVRLFTVTAQGGILPDAAIPMPGTAQPSGLSLSPDGKTLYVNEYSAEKVAVFSLAGTSPVLAAEIPVGRFPYGSALAPDGARLYVSNWGSHSVSVINTASGAIAGTITVGKNPEAVVISPDGARAYVANADDDSITIIDTAGGTRITDISVGPLADSPKGATPNALALSPDGRRLYVASAGDNSVDVIDTESRAVIGRIPAAWYPSAVAVGAGGDRLFVANAKGTGTGPNMPASGPEWTYIMHLMKGTLSVMDTPGPEALAGATERVRKNNVQALDYYDLECPTASPIPASPGQKSPIRHVVLIVRENKTYDCLLGDLGKGNADPSLVLFGKDVTPNLHALASEFVNLDNFYVDSEVSGQGHMWTVADNSTDYVEKITPAQYRDGVGPLSATASGEFDTPAAGIIFNHLARHGVSYRNYGEIVGANISKVLGGQDPHSNADYFKTTFKWPPFDMKDVDKAKYFLDELAQGIFPSFVYIWLPNDHTYGTSPGQLTPEAMVADNDEATGMIIDAVSRSPYWAETAVFVIEDDPQDGADHVDAHRSICAIASPWARRGYTSSVHYSIPSLYKTILRVLGAPPISRYDDLAPAMYDCFTDSPDMTPFTYRPRTIPDQYNLRIAPMAAESAKLDFSRVDMAEEALGKILWMSIHEARRGK